VFTADNGVVPYKQLTSTVTQASLDISSQGILSLLNNLNVKKAIGPDNIASRLLKQFSTSLSPIFQRFFTYSLSKTTVPSVWRKADICPVFKRGNVTQPLNYRPIALTSVICKQMEHIIAKHIRNFLDEQSILVDEQHGFRAHRSCESQLLTTVHDIASMIDQNNNVDAVILDFSKAFDKVSHPKLLSKLEFYGINRDIIGWIASWLGGRSQTVVIDGHRSTEAPVLSGVPQGSVLGPLLFIIFINDIVESCSGSIRLFADDALLYRPVSTQSQAQELQKDLDGLSEWSNHWQMEFNAKKCEVIHFSRSTTSSCASYHLNGTVLDQVTTVKYLGVTISGSMDWNVHIQQTVRKATGLLAMLQRQTQFCTPKTRLTLYKTIVRPTLDYASCVWSPHFQYQIKGLEKVQRRAVRWIKSLKGYDSVTGAMAELNLEPLEERRFLRDTAVLHKIMSGSMDLDIDKHLQLNSYNTRNRFVQTSTNSGPLYTSFFVRVVRKLLVNR
jgi:hypothetical protein